MRSSKLTNYQHERRKGNVSFVSPLRLFPVHTHTHTPMTSHKTKLLNEWIERKNNVRKLGFYIHNIYPAYNILSVRFSLWNGIYTAYNYNYNTWAEEKSTRIFITVERVQQCFKLNNISNDGEILETFYFLSLLYPSNMCIFVSVYRR